MAKVLRTCETCGEDYDAMAHAECPECAEKWTNHHDPDGKLREGFNKLARKAFRNPTDDNDLGVAEFDAGTGGDHGAVYVDKELGWYVRLTSASGGHRLKVMHHCGGEADYDPISRSYTCPRCATNGRNRNIDTAAVARASYKLGSRVGGAHAAGRLSKLATRGGAAQNTVEQTVEQMIRQVGLNTGLSQSQIEQVAQPVPKSHTQNCTPLTGALSHPLSCERDVCLAEDRDAGPFGASTQVAVTRAKISMDNVFHNLMSKIESAPENHIVPIIHVELMAVCDLPDPIFEGKGEHLGSSAMRQALTTGGFWSYRGRYLKLSHNPSDFYHRGGKGIPPRGSVVGTAQIPPVSDEGDHPTRHPVKALAWLLRQLWPWKSK